MGSDRFALHAEHHTIAPAWLVLPMAILTVLIVLVHLSVLHDPRLNSGVPVSRRRIRSAGGAVTLVTAVVLAYAFGIVTPAEPREFALAWMASMGLLGLVVLIAGLDALNSLRLHRRELRRHRSRRDALLAELHASVCRERPQRGPAGGGVPFGRDH